MHPIRRRKRRPTVGDRIADKEIGLFCQGVALAAALILCGCNLTPARPDAVFTVYRDRMKAENIREARDLLSEQSRDLATSLETTFKLRQSPEDLALLNALDPVSAPLIVEKTDTLTLLQVRTMKGGVRLVRVARSDSSSPWNIDLVDELTALRSFLEASRALEAVRDQAGEFAATWKAFSERLSTMPAPSPPAITDQPAKSPPKTKNASAKKQIKKPDLKHRTK